MNLSNQQAYYDQVAPKILQLKNQMDLRKIVWDKLENAPNGIQRKKQWILSDKDPLMTLSWDIFKYLHNNFYGDHADEYLGG